MKSPRSVIFIFVSYAFIDVLSKITRWGKKERHEEQTGIFQDTNATQHNASSVNNMRAPLLLYLKTLACFLKK